jgi:signal transduction histidine kinase/CheY-like chemotaxis protein
MTLPPIEDTGLDERRLEVLVKQGSSLRWQIVLTASIVAAIVWSQVPPAWVLAWWAAVVGVREWRSAALLRLLARTELPIAERLRRTVRWNALIGAVNGSAALFMLQLDLTQDALLTMVLVSWGAGGVGTGATVLAAFVAYGTMLFVPTALMWVLTGGWLGVGIGLLVLMFFGVQLRFARRNGEVFEESYRMRRENLDLARRLAEERQALAEARDAAEAANRAKSRFLAAASHDLRQPLQALALNSGELARCDDLESLRALAPDIVQGVRDLRAMLDGLLEISSLDGNATAVRPRNVALATLLEGVAASFRAAAAARGLALRWHSDPGLACHADAELLRRVLSNLTDNALKFTLQGHVELSAVADGGSVDIRVSDTGIGIAPAEQERIFDELVQLQNPERDRHKGYGLGLAIVRRLVELQGLKLTLQSQPGRGSVFTLRVPAAALAAAASGEVSATVSPAALHGWRVLVLDDDADVRAAYARSLSRCGAEVGEAADLAGAQQLLLRLQPHAALVDYRLRDGNDGLSAIAQLRSQQSRLAAVLCSADELPVEAAARAAAWGVRLLRKPVDAPALAAALQHARRSVRSDGDVAPVHAVPGQAA